MIDASGPSPLLRRLIVGIGNPMRGDDGAGLWAVRRVAACGMPGVQTIESAGDAAALVEALGAADEAWVIDAMVSGAPPGTVRRVEAHRSPIPFQLRLSSHDFGLGAAIALARALGMLPRRLILFGIEGHRFETGAGLSPAVERGAELAAELVRVEVKQALAAEASADPELPGVDRER